MGETKARSIIEYRRQNGPFRDVNELVKVEGIGTATLEEISHLITVAD
jgi:competence protein ComEA